MIPIQQLAQRIQRHSAPGRAGFALGDDDRVGRCIVSVLFGDPSCEPREHVSFTAV